MLPRPLVLASLDKGTPPALTSITCFAKTVPTGPPRPPIAQCHYQRGNESIILSSFPEQRHGLVQLGSQVPPSFDGGLQAEPVRR